MRDFTIRKGSYCPVCRGAVLSDCSHTMDQLRNAMDRNSGAAVTIARLTAERDRFREALEWYAERRRYDWTQDGDNEPHPPAILTDEGAFARAALEETQNE